MKNIRRKTIIDLYRFLDKHNVEFIVDKETVSIKHGSGYIRFKKETLLVRWDEDIVKEGDTIEKFIKIYPKYLKLQDNFNKLKNS